MGIYRRPIPAGARTAAARRRASWAGTFVPPRKSLPLPPRTRQRQPPAWLTVKTRERRWIGLPQSHRRRFVTVIPRTAYDIAIDLDNPISHWKMQNVGFLVPDRKKISNGNLLDAAVLVSGLLPDNINSNKSGQAYQFDGVDDTMTVTHVDAYLVTAATVEVWIKTSTIPNTNGYLITKGTAFRAFINSAGKVEAMINGNSGSSLTGNKVVVDGLVHHIVVAYEAGSFRIYIDGIVDKSSTVGIGALTTNTTDINIGGLASLATSYPGMIDEPAFYGSALTLSQALAHYIAGGGVIPASQPVPRRRTAISPASKSYRRPLSRAHQYRQLRRGLWSGTKGATPYDLVIDVDSPISHWKLDEPTNITVAKDRKRVKNGTYAGSPVMVAGVVEGNSFPHDNIDDNMTVADVPAYTVSDISLEIWIATPASLPAATRGIFYKSNEWTIEFLSGGALRARFRRSGALVTGAQTGLGAIVANNEYHIVAAYDGQFTYLYVNGKLAASDDYGSDIPLEQSFSNIQIGSVFSDIALEAVYDEAAIYGSILNLTRVQAHYIAGGGSLPKSLPLPPRTKQRQLPHQITDPRRERQWIGKPQRRERWVGAAQFAGLPMSSIQQKFDAGFSGPGWLTLNGAAWTADGQRIIALPDAGGQFVGFVQTNLTYRITDSYIFGEFSSVIDAGAGSSARSEIRIALDPLVPPNFLSAATKDYLAVGVMDDDTSGQQLFSEENRNAVFNGDLISYDSGEHRWWAIVHQDNGGSFGYGTAYFYYAKSPVGVPPAGGLTGNGWTRFSAFELRHNTKSKQELFVINSWAGVNPASGTFSIDNINFVARKAIVAPRRQRRQPPHWLIEPVRERRWVGIPISRHRWVGTSGDVIAPTPTVTIVDVSKISRVAGKDLVNVTFEANEAFVEYEIRRVTNASDPRVAGNQIETATVSSRTSHSIIITDDELIAGAGTEGTNLIKVFVKDAAGNWSS